ncbi:hypothetical protein [Blastococcus sp. CT_GayMR16]|uniref:hypothetical protein n=1 Tax=Blastococcus sp. CT_GayMR16 TaxID=2559607 RepID=UPI0010744FC0|nr:hypothetical protein [Blastococcus sp. CT_GayMR16]TFV83122.1 hypothetical protein E4P38_20930 [Blastococcus sp. CT_GayMR16]
MKRHVNTTSHRLRAHGLRPQRLIADYHRDHPGRVAAQMATRVPVAIAAGRPAVPDIEPATAGIPRILLRALAPSPAVAR